MEGGVYIEDGDPEMCGDEPYKPAKECSLQVLQFTFSGIILHQYYDKLNFVNIYFTNNTAKKAGPAIYGGLFDRCHTSMYAEISYLLRNNRSVDFLRSKTPLSIITNIQANQTNSLLASKPVRVCFCKEGVQN